MSTKKKGNAVKIEEKELEQNDMDEETEEGDLQEKFKTMRKEMQEALVERDEEIDMCLTALLSQHHALLVGSPGTGKSMIAEVLSNWIEGSNRLTIHCCKDTTRNAAFGPVRLSALKEDRTDRNLQGGAADAHILVLEEVFKSGPAVLDMFLMLMNERVYREGLVQAKSPLRFLLGVSNEWSPEGCEAALAAFFDRFLFRRAVKPIRTKQGIVKLLRIPTMENGFDRDHAPKLSTKITLEELDAANQQVKDTPFTEEAEQAFLEIHKELGKEGIVVGDRRLKLSVTACQAFAYLNGDFEVKPEYLEVLKDILWVDPQEQPVKAAKVVAKIANPPSMQINELLGQAEDVMEKEEPVAKVPKLNKIKKDLEKLPMNPRKEKALAYLSTEIRAAYRSIIGEEPK